MNKLLLRSSIPILAYKDNSFWAGGGGGIKDRKKHLDADDTKWYNDDTKREEVTQMMYRLWRIEYDEEHTTVTKQNYIYCQSKNQLIGAISKALDENENIEDIAILQQDQNQS